MNRDEFLQTPGILKFAEHIENELREFLGKVDASFAPIAGQPTMLLTGGGADIPFVRALLTQRWFRTPDILTGDEVQRLLLELSQRERVMVLLAGSTGLRRGN